MKWGKRMLSKKFAAAVAVAATATFAMGGGVALADHDNGPFEDCVYNTPPEKCAGVQHWAPVGQNLLDEDFPGRDGLPGNGDSEGEAANNIYRNPNCPAHWAP
jgi:hypothetical protein